MASIEYHESDDDKLLQPSDEDVLRDEEDTERLLEPPKSKITSLFRGEQDPNQPREASLAKREHRRQRRRERRARNRAGKTNDEASLMFEMEEGARRSSDDSISTTSEESFLQKMPPQTKKSVRLKLLHAQR